jgi:hypothetical protein
MKFARIAFGVAYGVVALRPLYFSSGKLATTLGYVECDVRDENNQLIARAGSTYLALNGTKGTGL